MKIALVRQRYLAHGGAERYMNAVAAELTRRGHEVHVFANRWEETTGGGVTFHRVPMVRATSFLRALTFALNARKMLAKFPCDVVFSFERTLRQDLYRAGDGCHREYLIQRLRHSSPLKRATIWLNPLHATMLWLERRTLAPQNTRLIIANSRRRKDEIVRHYGFPAERIVVLHNGVDVERFRPAALPRTGNGFVLLFVGSGFRGKGLAYCVRALARLTENVRLRVVGKGKPAPYVRLAQKLGVAGRIEFAPPTPKIEAEYAGADVFVLPAVYEAFANVCVEAMACGLPVVTTRINGASEIIQPGINGAIVEEPSDDAALAEAIRPFLNREVLARVSPVARVTAEKLPFAENVAQTLRVMMEIGARGGN